MSVSVDLFSESDVAASSSASPSASSESVGEGGITAIIAAMASSNVFPSIKSLEIVSVCFLPGVLGFLDFAELLPTSLSDLDDLDSQAVTAPRPNELANEGMVYLDFADRIVGVRYIFALQELFMWRYARQVFEYTVLEKVACFGREKFVFVLGLYLYTCMISTP